MNKILVIGPSPIKSKGGMATVIQGLIMDPKFKSKQLIKLHESYADGNKLFRLLFSIVAFIRFLFIYDKYNLFYIHMASYGSTFRKGCYIHFLKKRKKRVILHVHGAEYLIFYNNLSEKKKKRVEEIWQKCDVIIALSEKWKMQFEKMFSNTNILAINNGIDISEYEKAKCSICEVNNKFLFLGRIGKRKGVYDIVKAVERLYYKYPNILIYIAGDGEVDKLRDIIDKKRLNNNIKVVGWINFNEKINLLKEVGTVILPSYNEGLPMTILEGMAAGKVIISTKVGAIPEVVINDINGIIIPPGDIEQLCRAICTIIDNREFSEKCSNNNIEKIDSYFSKKMMHSKIEDIFNELSS